MRSVIDAREFAFVMKMWVHNGMRVIGCWEWFSKFCSFFMISGWPSTQPGSLHTALLRKYTQPCSLFSRSRLCEQWGHGCLNNGARLCASARLCRGSAVMMLTVIILFTLMQRSATKRRRRIQSLMVSWNCMPHGLSDCVLRWGICVHAYIYIYTYIYINIYIYIVCAAFARMSWCL